MAFISIFMMGMIFMSIIIFILAVLLVIKKAGMTLLAKKLGINGYSLLWLPGLGILYEGKIMNRFLNYGKKFEIGYFTIITIFRMIWLLSLFFGPRYNETSFDTYNSVISDTGFIIYLIDAVFKSITLKKSGYNTFISFIICILLPPFWCYFANMKTKKTVEVPLSRNTL